MWMPKFYREYKEKKEKEKEEEYQLRKRTRIQSLVYQLKFLDKETGEIYSCNFPYSGNFEVEFDEKIAKMNLISIDLFYLSSSFPEEEYFKYYLNPNDNKENEDEDYSV